MYILRIRRFLPKEIWLKTAMTIWAVQHDGNYNGIGAWSRIQTGGCRWEDISLFLSSLIKLLMFFSSSCFTLRHHRRLSLSAVGIIIVKSIDMLASHQINVAFFEGDGRRSFIKQTKQWSSLPAAKQLHTPYSNKRLWVCVFVCKQNK